MQIQRYHGRTRTGLGRARTDTDEKDSGHPGLLSSVLVRVRPCGSVSSPSVAPQDLPVVLAANGAVPLRFFTGGVLGMLGVWDAVTGAYEKALLGP